MAIALGYALVVALTALVMAGARHRAQGPPIGSGGFRVDPRTLPIEELALIAGGPRRATLTAVAGLHETGLVGLASNRAWLTVLAPLDVGSHDLRRAVYQTIDDVPHPRLPGLTRSLAGSPALVATRNRLAADGLVPAPELNRSMRGLRRVQGAMVVAGFILIPVVAIVDAAGLPLLLPAIALAVIGAIMKPPLATRHGAAVLAEARRRAPGLAGGGVSGQRAAAIALFGPRVAARADPTLARVLGLVPRSGSTRSGWWWELGDSSSAGWAGLWADGGSSHGGHGGHDGGGSSCGGGGGGGGCGGGG